MAAWCEEHLEPLLGALDPDLQHAVGVDFGRTGDQSVIAPGYTGRDLVRRVPFTVELRNVPFRQQEQILFYLCDRLPRFVAGKLDARGNGQFLAEVAMQRYGPGRIEQVMLSDKWYLEHLPPFRAAFEDGSILIPADADTVNDLRAFRVIGGVPKLPKEKTRGASDGRQRHGDAGIALALFYSATRSETEEYGYDPVPRPGAARAGMDAGDEVRERRLVRAAAGWRGGGVL